jgi:hypothetical protein
LAGGGEDIFAGSACRRTPLAMKVEDVYVQNRRLWVRLHEKGGKRREIPCHHNLETYLHGAVTLPCEERERSTPYGFLCRRDGLTPRGHRRGA